MKLPLISQVLPRNKSPLIGGLLARAVRRLLLRRASKTPYFHLDGYMERFWLIPKTAGLPLSARVHRILRSDDDSAMHDHPWWNWSFVLENGYHEVMPVPANGVLPKGAVMLEGNPHEPACVVHRPPGSFVRRTTASRHRLILLDGPVLSVFAMGRKSAEWGFWVREDGAMKKIHWKDYTPHTPGEPEPAPGQSVPGRIAPAATFQVKG